MQQRNMLAPLFETCSVWVAKGDTVARDGCERSKALAVWVRCQVSVTCSSICKL
jgi:hypothetical protein